MGSDLRTSVVFRDRDGKKVSKVPYESQGDAEYGDEGQTFTIELSDIPPRVTHIYFNVHYDV